MVYYLVTPEHTYTLHSWIEYYSESLRGRVRILPYTNCHGRVHEGTFIFSDFERLSPIATREATRIWRKLQKRGCRTLNHPGESLRRYDLQKALRNDFRVFRVHEVPSDLRYPVFLRIENDHLGSLTDLLHDAESYNKARAEHPSALVVEYLETRNDDGYYVKYSIMRIGDQIIPRHVLFSRDWIVKLPDVVDESVVRKELDYFEENPHEGQVREIFETAGIEFGRIDYSLHEGRIQTWEINSNPTLTSPLRATNIQRYQQRAELHERSADRINAALLELDSGRVYKKVRLSMPRTLRPESRFAI